ncbi:MAG: glycosyltransferase [Bdellovibrio sp.]|nr:glycosyltransferase [Bdellovibrio sp.]
MKIMYVDMQWDYGKKERGINQIGEIGFHQVFKKLGHEVIPFYFDDYIHNPAPLQAKILATADEINPDLIIFTLYTDQFTPETLDLLKKKFKTLSWFGDDQWRFESYTAKYAPHFTYSVTTDHFAVSKYKKLGIQNVIVSQWASLDLEEAVDPSFVPEYKYEVSFVGGFNTTRAWIIDEFKKAGINVNVWGRGWPNGGVDFKDMVRIFQQTKVNLNLSNSVSYDIRCIAHSLRSLLVTLRNRKNASQMKARNFEIPCFGGFQLADYVPSLEAYFNIGKDIACYSTVDEAIMLTRYYLENDVERELIRKNSIKRIQDSHTYLHRFEKIFKQI